MAARRAVQHLLRVGAGAFFASVPFVSSTVYAADGSEDEHREGHIVKISDLSPYDNPEDQNRYRYVEEEINLLRQVVSEGRRALWEYLDTVQGTTDKIKDKYETGKAHTQGVIDYIQNDPGMLPRVIVITIAGLGGVVAGYRGGAARKAFYSAAAITAAASFCYPNQAVELTNSVFDFTKEKFRAMWPLQEFREGPTKSPEARKVMMDPLLPPPTPGLPQGNSSSQPAVSGDLGMSREEDQDMYTTRSS